MGMEKIDAYHAVNRIVGREGLPRNQKRGLKDHEVGIVSLKTRENEIYTKEKGGQPYKCIRRRGC